MSPSPHRKQNAAGRISPSLLLPGPILALCGALGMLTFHSALCNVLNVLRGLSKEILTDQFGEMYPLLAFAGIFTIGSIATLLSVSTLAGNLTPALWRTTERVAGVLLCMGAMALITGIWSVHSAFQAMLASVEAPTPEVLDAAMNAGKPKILLGCLLCSISAIVSTAGVVVQISRTTSIAQQPVSNLQVQEPGKTTLPVSNLQVQGTGKSTQPVSKPQLIVAATIGFLVCLCLFAMCRNVQALTLLISGEHLVKPHELVTPILSIFRKSIVVFGAFLLLGIAQVWGSLRTGTSSFAPDAESS